MCRVEEKVYVAADGTRQQFEDSFPCHNARRGYKCSNVTRKKIEYVSKPPQIARDDTSSPASYNPPTPTGTSTILVEPRGPSGSGARPPTREGARPKQNEIFIEFGKKKGKSTKYPSTASRTYKRSSLGAVSISSNDVAVESPGSDASYTVRTGFPEATVPPNDTPGYTTRPAVPRSHHRHTSSASSFTTSSQPPSLYATSEAESPNTRRPARYPPTIIHNPPPGASSGFAPSSPTVTRGQGATPSSPYHVTIVTPRSSDENVGVDGIFPINYTDFQSSSHASSGRAPEITDRDAERARQRKARADAEKKRQEYADSKAIQRDEEFKAKARDEDARQVRFELGRAESRAKERAENQFAQNEMKRADEREEARRRKSKEQEERAAQEARKQKADRLRDEIARKERDVREAEARHREKRDSRPPVRDPTRRNSRRNSMSQQDFVERQKLLAETEAQMAREREAAEQRERDERAELLRQQQQTTQYWDPRGGVRYPVPNEPGIGRRNSVSGRRGSVSSNAPTIGIGRRNSQRGVSIIQNVPPINTSVNHQYSTRPGSSHLQSTQTTLFSPGSARPPSARHSSYHDNAFAHPPTRTSNTSQDNPFVTTGTHPSVVATAGPDFWDLRHMQDALPRESGQSRQLYDDRQRTLRRRGQEVLEQATPRQHDHTRQAKRDEGTEQAARRHDRARQAAHSMNKAVNFEDEDTESGSEDSEDKLAGYGPRLGRGKPGKRRN